MVRRALFLLGCSCLLCSAAIAEEKITYRTKIQILVENMFPDKGTVEEISEQYIKGRFKDKELHSRMEKVLALRGKSVEAQGDVVAQFNGDDFLIEVPSIKLPDKSLERRRVLLRNGQYAHWSIFKDATIGEGTLANGWADQMVWAAVASTLLQYLPSGVKFDKQGISSNDEAFYAQPIAGPGKPDGDADANRNYVIHYRDASKTSIESIECFWNTTSTSPFIKLDFEGSRIEGTRHFFDRLTIGQYSGGKIESVQSFEHLDRAVSEGPIDVDIPVGQRFIDRRAKDQERHYTFAYDGKAFPGEVAVDKMFSSNKSGETANHSSLLQLLAGGGFLLIGATLWSKAKRAS